MQRRRDGMGQGMTEREDHQQAIEAQAAQWVVRLEAGPLDALERRAMNVWLRRSEAHAQALDYAQRTWAELGQLRAEPGAAEAAAPAGNANRVAHTTATQRSGVSPRWAWRSMAASLAIVIGLGLFYADYLAIALRADYRTAAGEVRAVTLPDGSTAELNTATAIAVDFDRARREITLLSGEAAFTVAAAAEAGGRPFVVLAAGGEAKALGTRFLVREQDEAAKVAVLQHRVAVTPPNQAQGADALVLEAGQAVRYDSVTGLGPVRTIDPTHVAAWRRGKLIFDRVPLSEVVAELNRYRFGRILIVDSALAARRVSGVFRLDDLDVAIAMIAAELGARTASLPPLITVLY